VAYNKKYEVIIFDLGNTLIRFDHNIAARKIAESSGIGIDNIYNLFFDSELTRAFEKGAITSGEFHEKISNVLGHRLPYDEFVGIWNEIFWADEDSCALARELKSRYKLFLLSNINELHFDYIRKKFAIINIFDKVIVSYLVGAMKPDRKIFEHVIELAGQDRTKLLYVDDREDLVKEAMLLGIDSVRFEGAPQLRKTFEDMKII
jgi:glucose-1-phosphatase